MPISVAVTPAHSLPPDFLPAGHMLELKIEPPPITPQNNVLVAYDTMAYSSLVRVRYAEAVQERS
jgi:hypothetical protein